MQTAHLGDSEIRVSKICLGSMTWGEQNTEAEGRRQLDMALDHGVNFIDTAEMYAVPARAETYGATEKIIGSWLKNQPRDKVVIATKIAGPADWLPHIRAGKLKLDRTNIENALNASLARLQTDYVDLYQVHWPERNTNYFGRLGYTHHADQDGTLIEETLSALADQVTAGKIRAIGVSNETPWGVMRYLHIAQRLGLPRIVSIQNPYNLLNRTFEIGLAEIAHREAVGLLAYSPLGFGVLTGKYLGGAQPPEARLTRFPQFRRYTNPAAERATERYAKLAQAHGLSLTQMALAFVNSRPFATSSIIGATDDEQCRENIESIHITLDEVVLKGIEDIHTAHPNPSP
ncbi:MAG: NADP(H)-dependent aldo-keto reductase [Gammaproteobacteria bacterium]|nr:NADP(H)-dependent aldo-keto reductase [Gammaproteobacteria bacterium]